MHLTFLMIFLAGGLSVASGGAFDRSPTLSVALFVIGLLLNIYGWRRLQQLAAEAAA